MRVALIGVLFVISTLGSAMASNPPSAKFRQLPPQEEARLDEHRAFVRELMRQHFPGTNLTGKDADFVVLQKIVDSKLIKVDETWKLQSLGVVFGDALVSYIEGLSWCEVTDEYGTDVTLRYCETSLQANALTMISKRVEDRRDIDVKALADWLKKSILEKASKGY
jgi:hypothetical protein